MNESDNIDKWWKNKLYWMAPAAKWSGHKISENQTQEEAGVTRRVQ